MCIFHKMHVPVKNEIFDLKLDRIPFSKGAKGDFGMANSSIKFWATFASKRDTHN